MIIIITIHGYPYIVFQVVDAFNSVNGMDAECITSEMEIFRDWDRFLKKNLKPLPTGFTENYCFEVANGAVVYKPLVSTPDEDGKEHVFCNNLVATRNAILAELLGLPPTAELTDIADIPGCPCWRKDQLPSPKRSQSPTSCHASRHSTGPTTQGLI